jgi:23S rRNA (uridine2552-2'-O)-methyltransferase
VSAQGTLLDRSLLGFGALDLTPCGEPLVAQHPHGFDLGALTTTAAVLQHLEVARAGFAFLVQDFFLDGFRAPQHQQFADVLDGGSVETVRQGLEQGVSDGAVVAQHTHLDESVGIESGVDFSLHGVGQAVLADHDDGFEMVRQRAVFLALSGRELNGRHGGIIPSQAGFRLKIQTKSKKVNKAWLNDHVNDPYVKMAQKEGYRARAAYKLKEIDEQLGLIRPGQVIVDLGSSPGAWSQYARRRLSPQGAAVGELDGTLIGLDILPMEPIEGVTFLQGDFREDAVLAQLQAALDGRQVDVVISDMAPNLSGIASADSARISHLVELAVAFSQAHLKPQGALVVKVFHGSGYSQLAKLFKDTFVQVKPIKPKASRDKSSETFLVGRGLKKRA